MLHKKISFLSLIFVITLNSIYSQEIGQIFTANEANSKFGEVIESKKFDTQTVKNWLNSSEDKIMFKLENNSLSVLSDERNLVYSDTRYSELNEEFHIYSKSKLVELLNKGGSSTTYFEKREKVFSISNGKYTLEFSYPCPPFCD